MKTCEIKDCSGKHYAKDLCRKHYARLYRNGHTDYVGNQPKKCNLCSQLRTSSGLCKTHYYELIKKPYQRKYMKKRINTLRKNNINFKILDNLRRRLYSAVKSKNIKTIETLGCTVDELKKHLESKFQPGMTWNNYGRNGWHIDHIKPLSSFNLSDLEQLKKANNFNNLQPLWESDNIRKSSKFIP